MAIALPVATAIAGNGNGKGQVKSLTAKHCNAEKRADSVAFQARYGDLSGEHAVRNCKRQTSSEVIVEVRNAAQECAALRDQMGALNFILEFGTNLPPNRNEHALLQGKGFRRNAFGKCVSGKVGQAIGEDVEEFQTAAQQCRAARAADPDAFLGMWGNNVSEGQNNAPDGEKSKGAERKAFGKCISSTARQLEQGVVEEPTTEEEPPPAV